MQSNPNKKSIFAIGGVLTIALLLAFVLLSTGAGTSLLGTPAASAQTETNNGTGPVAAPISALPQDAGVSLADMVAEQELLADLYQQVLPSVVNIQVVTAPNATMSGIPQDFPFNMPGQDTPRQGEGSGWVYDDQGHIVTNNHVVENATQITVIFSNGAWADAEVVAADPQADLAVLKVTVPEGVDAPPLALAQANSLRVGYSVIAIGSPFGNDRTMTTGIVSALGRSFPVGDGITNRYTLPDVIQTDAAINPGNSGGPLLNLNGQVVGVNFAINSPVRANSGIGFAIPVAIVDRVVPALIEDGAYAYPFLGISGQSITPEVARALDLPNNLLGAIIGSVLEDGPSADSGLEAEDIIIAMDSTPIYSFDDLVAHLVTHTAPGQSVDVTVLRDGEALTLPVTLGERPTNPTVPIASALPNQGPGDEIGIEQAITIAQDAVDSTGMLGEISSTDATLEEREEGNVWVVTLSGESKEATVVVDAQSGDVVEMSVR